MKIHTKALNGYNSNNETGKAMFLYAKEVLGDSWTLTDADTITPKLSFVDPTGSGEQGWRFGGSGSTIISNGLENPSYNTDRGDFFTFTTFTGLVWESENGSVGFGFVDSNGKYNTVYTLIKLDGRYEEHDVYAVAVASSLDTGRIMVHGNINISTVNQFYSTPIGRGVYLHSLFDPVSGLTSSDAFGIQSVDSTDYGNPGTIIKQGGTSYMSIIGGLNNKLESSLFVKM